MKPLSQTDMAEATRLTVEGRLDEAIALLRGAIRTTAAPATSSEAEPKRQPAPPPRAPEFVDLIPPSAATGDCWTSPQDKPTDKGSKETSPPRTNNDVGHQADKNPPRILPELHRRTPGAGRRAPVLPEGARFEERAFTNEAGTRRYKLYIPSSFTGQPVPLVMMMHGCTQSPDDFAAGTRMNLLAEEFSFLVAYPAQPKSANPSKCWNWFRPGDQCRGQGEPALIAGIAQQIAKDFPIVCSQIYAAGLSAGGAAAAILGATYPDIFAAIGVHSGLACGAATDIPSAFSAMRQGELGAKPYRRAGPSQPVPTIVFHGDRDTTVSPINGDQVIAQAKGDADLSRSLNHGYSRDGIKYTCIIEADPSGRTIVENWTLHGCGHAWSGGSTEGSYTEPRGPDASREMIRFFLQHRTPSTAES
jgi:poly(hydroxyalkanoate) depolymerase family esterase